MSLVAGTRLGPYEIVAPLGSGGMGEVYRARDTRLDRTVAIKILKDGAVVNDDLRQRFEREARVVSQLTHPHICALYDVGHHNGFDFFVMEYVDGETLTTRLARRALPLTDGLEAMAEIAEAIACAHRQGIVHRDLTPSNIMLTTVGAKLLDFGLATLSASLRPAEAEQGVTLPTTRTNLAGDGAVLGTLPYMAPEQLERQDADPRSDIFAFGAVMYEVVTGRRAFAGTSQARIIAQILGEDPPPMTLPAGAAPPAVERIVRTCLAKNPSERWQDASDLLRELRWVIEDERQRTPRRRFKLPALSRVPRRVAVSVALIALALLAVGVGVWRRAPVAATSRLLVVLPCQAIGDADLEQKYCDGLAATLTAKLARLTASHQVQVVPASEIRARRLESPEAARREVGATLAFEGSFLREGKSLRVNYALVDTATRSQLDAFSFTAAGDDPFAIQDRVIEWALAALELKLSDPERHALTQRDTQMAGVYEYYLQGRGYLVDFHRPGNIDTAIILFQRALALDPQHALSHAGLGEAYWLKYEATREPGWVDQSRVACRKAVTLDAGSAAAYICLGTVDLGTGEYEKAVADFEHALRTEPTSDEAYVGLARAQDRLGLTEAAEQTYRQAVDLRPAYWASRNWLGAFYRGHGRYDAAIQQYEQAVQLTPDNALAYAYLSYIYALVGRYDEALEASEKSVAIVATTFGYVGQGMTLYRLRRFDEAVAALEMAKDLRTDFRSIGDLARACYWAGNRDRARALYTQAIDLTRRELAVNPRNADPMLLLAEAHAKMGERAQALELLGQVRLDDPHQQHFAAMTYNTLGERSVALELLRKARAGALPASELSGWIDLDSLRGTPEFANLIR
jgi:eukaryotic-like serine/threonine-protein kinase